MFIVLWQFGCKGDRSVVNLVSGASKVNLIVLSWALDVSAVVGVLLQYPERV